MSNTVA